ncbi:C factor, cell signaling protein [Pelagivirga sediminicola]|uniref:C factor, cell signaling protein n=1 Tax=Pelagivirga sediminicola TaxID=2170575 RepID=A0A2T7G7K7_9RHOB|nr:SDR family NAD(P)-dependent oxidoreductase [Pelagivirga sediminicola]PVA10411.1 C factor, cell signaling protein [Pelagivirga sediminicola]
MTHRSLIIGASGGIGQAITAKLKQNGSEVTTLSRSADGLDVTDEASVKAALEGTEGEFQLIFVATGALEIGGAEPEKALKDITAQAMADQFAVNCIGPSLVMKHALSRLPRKGPGCFAALSARVGSIGDNGIGGWYSYRTAKAALNQMIHTAAIELKRTHREAVCVALHPGTVETPFTAKYAGRHKTVKPEEAAHNLLSVLEGLGPEDSGQFFDWQGESVAW